MASKEDMEEGEISDISDGEVPLGHYTPLERPVTAKAVLPPCDKNGMKRHRLFWMNFHVL